jgi:hypothetical protein
MLQSEPALLTIFKVQLRGALDVEGLLDGPVIVEPNGDATILATADLDAERKLGSMEVVEAIERVGRAIIIPPEPTLVAG